MNINDIDPDKLADFNTKILSQYIKANPEVEQITLYRIIRDGIDNLKHYIENPKEKEISWGSPGIQLNYNTILEEFPFTSSLPLITLHTKDEDVEISSRLFNTLFRDFPESLILARLSDHMAWYNTGKESHLLYLKQDSEEFKKLTQKKQEKFLEKLFNKYGNINKIPTFTFPFTYVLKETKGKKRKSRGSLIIDFQPLYINEVKEEAYYPLIIGLQITGDKPIYWSDEDKREFWDEIGKVFKDSVPQESFDFLEKLAEPEVKPVKKRSYLVKASMHLENQKFGSKPKSAQGSILDLLDKEDRVRAEEHNINIVGVDFTASQNRALFALQTLLAKTEHKGNLKKKVVESIAFKYEGRIPSLKFTRSEFLDTYGVPKRKTTRGKMEYNSNESEEALKALRSLSENKYLLYYTRKYFDKRGVEKYDVIRTVRSLINIVEGFKNLTKLEKDIVISDKNSRETNTKLSHIVVELSPTFVDQIDNYYVLKPANVYEELKIKAPHSSKFVYRFIDYLLAQVSKKQSKYKGNNKDWNIKINYKNLAHILKMDSWIKTRNWKQVRGSLNKSYEIAKELGYLEDYKTTKGKTDEIELLTLNPDKFYKAEEIKKTREKMENEARI